MTWTLLAGITGFAFVASITPGPNNIMLLTSGANFGLRRTIPHLTGVVLGFGLMIGLLGLGMAEIIKALPGLFDIVRWAGAAYLVVLAFKIATSVGIADRKTAKPLSFLQAAAFQWVNPKGWAMALGALSAFVDRDQVAMKVALVVVLFLPVNALAVTSWAVAGTAMKRVLSDPVAMRIFNVSMGVLLVLSLYPMLRS